jgi:preprotein translocase subunit SecE
MRKNYGKREATGGAGVADAANREHEDEAVSDITDDAGGDEFRPREPEAAKPRGTGPLALKIYKPGQGYYTRIGTAIGLGILVLFGAQFVYEQLNGLIPQPGAGQESSYRLPLLYGITTAFMLGMGALTYWVVGVHRKANDFFIATEGEMKKVSWSSRKEVIKSTKVVVIVVVLMACFLFFFDIAFMLFFGAINVLKVAPPWLENMFGRGS